MKKFWNVFKIILITLLTCLGVAIVVFYIVDKEQTKETLSYVWGLLNQPLPIIGATTLAVLFFIWRIIITTKYGKKALEELKNEKEQLKQDHKTFIDDANNELSNCYAKIDELRHELANVCNLSTNQKIKAFGKELEYGKETVDSETKAD